MKLTFVFRTKYRRGFEGVSLGVCSSVDATQSEGDPPDPNQSEHQKCHQHTQPAPELLVHPEIPFYLL